MYHPGRVIRQRLNESNYYQQVIDLLPIPDTDIVDLPHMNYSDMEEWESVHAADRMIAVRNRFLIQTWGTNRQHEDLEIFLGLIWGRDVYILAGKTRDALNTMQNDALWCLILYLNGEDIVPRDNPLPPR